MEIQDKWIYTLFDGTRVQPLHIPLRQGYPYNLYDPSSGVSEELPLRGEVQGMV